MVTRKIEPEVKVEAVLSDENPFREEARFCKICIKRKDIEWIDTLQSPPHYSF